MPNNGAKTSSLNCGGSYTIPAGYHNGSGKVTANSLASQTDGDAVAGDIIVNKKVWVKGVQITGTMPNNGAKTSSLNCGGSYTIPAGYHNGSGKITANSLSSQTAGNLAANVIRSGYYGYSNGSKVTGNIASLAGGTYTPSSSSQTISCSGKYMTSNVVINGDADLVAANIVSGKNIFGVAGIAGNLKCISGSGESTSSSSVSINGYTFSNRLILTNLSVTPAYVIYFGGGDTYQTWIFTNGSFSNYIIFNVHNGYYSSWPCTFTKAKLELPTYKSGTIWYYIFGTV